jgi:hypothetical protein
MIFCNSQKEQLCIKMLKAVNNVGLNVRIYDQLLNISNAMIIAQERTQRVRSYDQSRNLVARAKMLPLDRALICAMRQLNVTRMRITKRT